MRAGKEGEVEIWRKKLADGSVAVAIFNRGAASADVRLAAADAGYASLTAVRDLWQGGAPAGDGQVFRVAGRGAVLLEIRGE